MQNLTRNIVNESAPLSEYGVNPDFASAATQTVMNRVEAALENIPSWSQATTPTGQIQARGQFSWTNPANRSAFGPTGAIPSKYAGPASDAALAAVTGQIPAEANIHTGVNYANPTAVKNPASWAYGIQNDPNFQNIGVQGRPDGTYFGTPTENAARAPSQPGITPGGLAPVNQAIDNIGSPTNAAIAAALGVPQNIADAVHAAFGPGGFASLPASVQSALHAAFGVHNRALPPRTKT
jgi:hypothetical protein